MVANVLTIAGSDPSGGAGIQADLKTFSALGVFGTSVITALTAQNTCEVTAVHQIPAEFVAQQIDTLLADVKLAAVKVGMLGDADTILTVEERLRYHHLNNIVLDPVMVAKSGARLLDIAAIEQMRNLCAIATILTPNLPEAAALLERSEARTLDEMQTTAEELQKLGPRYVLLKGGHLSNRTDCVDMLYDGHGFFLKLSAPRIETSNTHGTGCTLSSAIAALIAQRTDPIKAIEEAKQYISRAIQYSNQLSVGNGHGPVHHFHALW